jgi:hypothetical protein
VPDAEQEAPGTDGHTTETARGKGRPTPKRRDVVGARGPVTAPRTRKEAYARQKANARASRAVAKPAATGSSARQLTPAQRRAALRSGELITRRDQGNAKALARDYVDSHRMLSNYLLILLPLIFASYVVRSIELVTLVLLLIMIAEWVVVGRRLRKLVIERHGSSENGWLTLGFYAGSRAYLPRRWRLPAPRVERGDVI